MVAPATDDTEQKILTAALDVFSSVGYRNASVREICRRAGVNAALAHYHFGDKAGLYRATVLATLPSFEAHLPLVGEPREVIRALYLLLLGGLELDSVAEKHASLHAWEQFEPSGVLGEQYLDAIRANHKVLTAYLAAQLNTDVDVGVHHLTFSIAGLPLLYRQRRPLVDALCPELLADTAARNRLLDKLVDSAMALLAQEKLQRGVA